MCLIFLLIIMQQIIEVAKQEENQHNDVKVEELQDIIDKILSADPSQKIIVFTEFVATQIFISTDAGGEGLNLQFSNVIINYDLPWNPR